MAGIPNIETSKLDQSETRYYTSVMDLPLSKYIEALCNDNLSALTISGFPTEQQLKDAWEQIQSECADIAGNLEHRVYLSSFREIHALSTTLDQIEFTIGFLEAWIPIDVPDEQLKPFFEKLEGLLYEKLTFTPFDKDAYRRQLRGCYNRSRSIKIDLDLKLMQFQEIEHKANNPDKKPTKQYFHSVLITISDFAHYPITDNIMVYEFYERIRRYDEYCKQVAKTRKHG